MDLTRITLFLALGAALNATEASDVDKPKPKAEASATVTVTAEATPVEIAKTPNQVKVLDKAAIERSGATQVADLLRDLLPGQILSNGGIGTATSVFLGGTRSQDVVVTLDGVRLTDASGMGSVNPYTLSLAGIERIEVQTGPCSTRWGTDAMGGVIALYSSGSAAQGLSGNAAVGMGTQGIATFRGQMAYGWNKGWVRAGGQLYTEDQATPTQHPFRTTGAFLSVGQEVGQDGLLTVSYRNTYLGVPIPYASVSPSSRGYDAKRETRNRNEQLVGSYRTLFGSDWLAEFTVGHVTQNRMEPAYGGGFSPYDSRRTQTLGRLTWTPSAAFKLSGGVDAYEEIGQTAAYPTGTDEGKGRHLGLDVEGTWEPLSFLRFLGTVRHQWDRQNFVQQGPGPRLDDTRSDQTTWKAGVNVMLGAGFRAYASGGTAFGLPLLSAVMYNASNGITTPLTREESTFANVGLGWERGPWNARLEASRTNFKSLVYFDLNSYVYANGSKIRTQSLEGSLGYRANLWSLEGFYRNQEARDTTQPAALQLSSSAVVRRPFNTFGLKSFASMGDFRFDARWSWFGPRYENFGYVYPTGSVLGASKIHFNDASLSVTWSAAPELDLVLRGDHLMQPKVSVDEWKRRTQDGHNDAYLIFGFPAQPPTLTFEARYRF